jgi:hypothetical protein
MHVVPSLLYAVLRARCDLTGSTLPLAAPPSTRLLPYDRFQSVSHLMPIHFTIPYLLTARSTPSAFTSWCSPIPTTTECGEAAGAGRSSNVGTDEEAVGVAQICTAHHCGSPPPPPTPNTAARHKRHLRHLDWPLSQIASSTSPAPAASIATCTGCHSPKMDSVDSHSMGWDWE